jgi:hypothetical protein
LSEKAAFLSTKKMFPRELASEVITKRPTVSGVATEVYCCYCHSPQTAIYVIAAIPPKETARG